MKAGKWNYNTKKYDEYELPEKARTYSDDLNLECQCASCGKPMIFGDGYTSLEIHTNMGFGYIVCADCYEQEFNRKYKKEQQ